MPYLEVGDHAPQTKDGSMLARTPWKEETRQKDCGQDGGSLAEVAEAKQVTRDWGGGREFELCAVKKVTVDTGGWLHTVGLIFNTY